MINSAPKKYTSVGQSESGGKGDRPPTDFDKSVKPISTSGKYYVHPHMSGMNIWINFEALQQNIRHINPWKKCSNLVQFLEYLVEPFLRPLRSKDSQC